jgi:hypothetical protein
MADEFELEDAPVMTRDRRHRQVAQTHDAVTSSLRRVDDDDKLLIGRSDTIDSAEGIWDTSPMSAPKRPHIVPATARIEQPPKAAKAQRQRQRRQVAAWQRKANRR